MRSSFLVTIGACATVLLAGACGPASPAGDPHSQDVHDLPPEKHTDGFGEQGPGPLVHRFQEASDWAKEFDAPERIAWQKPEEVVTLLQLATGMKVADIGAGTGYFEPYLAKAVGQSGQVYALDIEDSMVKYIDERMHHDKITNVTAIKVPTDDPKLAPASVDRILFVDTWHHVPGREAYAKKLADALVPGGFVAIVDFTMEAPHGPPKMHRILPEDVKKELESAGLKGEIATETLPEQYVVIGKKASK
jgi:ubiquinone/menaquinone biosynthesis C-methylase UbiE